MIYDAAVIGAGPAGATAALMLARAGWSVALVEKAPFPRGKVCGEFISATSLPLLFELGVGAEYLEMAGPPVLDAGLFAGTTVLRAPLPVPAGAHFCGRALNRETFDLMMLRAAARAGADIRQPWTVRGVGRSPEGFRTLTLENKGAVIGLHARIVIAAHGSWEPGCLPTQAKNAQPRPSDLLAFKARFTGAALPAGLMPLLVFPGGYGGLVASDGGHTTLSCCIRRDRLRVARQTAPAQSAAEAVLAHVRAHCAGVERALVAATPAGRWLAAGPIRPGMRPRWRDGIFAVGNAAGEAHPLVAEGISMAIQSAWLLSRRLVAARAARAPACEIEALARAYAGEWRRNFGGRIYASRIFAQLAVNPVATAAARALLERMPALLTAGARVAGKASALTTA